MTFCTGSFFGWKFLITAQCYQSLLINAIDDCGGSMNGCVFCHLWLKSRRVKINNLVPRKI